MNDNDDNNKYSLSFFSLCQSNPTSPSPSSAGSTPVIPGGYNKVAEHYVQQKMVTREQLAMVSVLMSRQVKCGGMEWL